MLLQINISVQNVLHPCSRETTRGFLKIEKKSRIDYQWIMWGINKSFFLFNHHFILKTNIVLMMSWNRSTFCKIIEWKQNFIYFQFKFYSNISIDLLQHSNFQAAKLISINVPFQASLVPGSTWKFLSPVFQLKVLGLMSHGYF